MYLVFTGGGGDLLNVLSFQFVGSPGVIEVASNSVISGGSFLETSSEGAMDLTNIFDGQSEMGDLIANGLTGAGGYVNEPTLNGIVGIAYNIEHYEAGYTAPYFGAPIPVTPTPASSFNGSAGDRRLRRADYWGLANLDDRHLLAGRDQWNPHGLFGLQRGPVLRGAV